MADHATSSDKRVQAQLDRLASLSPGADILGLERISELLARLGDPHLRLPPVFHVAGTNGKGSTCAYLRAALEAEGYLVHVFTSPHLVHFNERIRLAGCIITDEALAVYLGRVLDVAEGIGPSFFEVTTAAAFLAFAETPADACIVEVGLGGRLDATNVIPQPLVCGIAQLALDHQAFLGDDLAGIAAEKAGIAKPGAPLVTLSYDDPLTEAIDIKARRSGAMLKRAGRNWAFAEREGKLLYRDADGPITLPLPVLAGTHQQANLALAVAMLRHQDQLAISLPALAAGARFAAWPARLQKLRDGPLTARLPHHNAVWLDGGHNPAAAQVLAAFFPKDAQLHLVIGMLANKDASGFLAPFKGKVAHIHALPVPGHDHHPPEVFSAIAAEWSIGFSAHGSPAEAFSAIGAMDDSGPVPVLIAGSLYLAGAILDQNGQAPE